MSRHFDRRQFLVGMIQNLAGLGLSPRLIASLIGISFKNSIAEATSNYELYYNKDGFRYLNISLSAAPPRWLFDLPITPFGSTQNEFRPGGFGTGFEISNSSISLVNQTFRFTDNGRTFELPPVWGMNLPSVNYAQILLPHSLFVRGMDMEINSHEVSAARQLAPVIGGTSLQGVMADLNLSPIAAIGFGGPATESFRSQTGQSIIQSVGANPISSLLAPLKQLNPALLYRTNEIAPIVEQFLNSIDQYAKNLRISQSSLRAVHNNADELITKNLFQLSSTWDTLLGKYQSLIQEALHPSKGQLPGLFDVKIPFIANDPRYRFQNSNKNAVITTADLRDAIQESTSQSALAPQLAFSEFLLSTGLTSSLGLNLGESVLRSVRISDTPTNNIFPSTTIPCDQHGVGSIVSTLTTTLYYRGLLTGLGTLVQALKDQNVFDKTIIHISSEFNRNPRGRILVNDPMNGAGSGSDHGVGGSNATLISGLFEGLEVLGHIKTNSNSPDSPGTWGDASPWTFDEGESRAIRVNDIARTITTMVGGSDIVSNGYALLTPNTATNGRTWVPKKRGASNV